MWKAFSNPSTHPTATTNSLSLSLTELLLIFQNTAEIVAIFYHTVFHVMRSHPQSSTVIIDY